MAAQGFIAVMPDSRMAWNDDPQGDAQDILAVMHWAMSDASLAGKIDPRRRVLGGHSSGGLAALVAASTDPSIRALLLLDTEGTDVGLQSAAQVSIPTLAIFGDSSVVANDNLVGTAMCTDSDGTGLGTFQALAGTRFGLRIRGASHCAAESPTSAGCEIPCGSATPEAQQAYQRYVMTFLAAYVACDSTSFPVVDPRAPPAVQNVELLASDNRGTPSAVCAK
jgi:pimeloyl-ACP methyl ester carboxylesterase